MDLYVLRVNLWICVTYIKVVSAKHLNSLFKTEVDIFMFCFLIELEALDL